MTDFLGIMLLWLLTLWKMLDDTTAKKIWRSFTRFMEVKIKMTNWSENKRPENFQIKWTLHGKRVNTEKICWTHRWKWCLLLEGGLGAVFVISTTSCHSTKESTRLVMVSLADSTDDCTGMCTGNDANLGSEKVLMTPSPQHNDRISTQNAYWLWQQFFEVTINFGHKSTLDTYSCSLGKSVIVTDLGKLVGN